MTLPEAASPPLPRRSVPEPRKLDFQWERLADIAREAAPLVRLHWEEVALFQDKLTFDIDWSRWLVLESAGVLHILTARKDGVLAGFCFSYILPSGLYAGKLWATTEGFWLDPTWREGINGIRLFKETEIGLRERGVTGHTIEIMSHINADRGTVGVILKRLGYEMVGHTYGKVF